MKNKDAEKNNPCLREQELTYKCFNENNFDKEACKLQIENYKTCKSFWTYIKAERRKKGIKPELPPVEEREQIKKEFFDKVKHNYNASSKSCNTETQAFR